METNPFKGTWKSNGTREGKGTNSAQEEKKLKYATNRPTKKIKGEKRKRAFPRGKQI